jgi:hypothetical protein
MRSFAGALALAAAAADGGRRLTPRVASIAGVVAGDPEIGPVVVRVEPLEPGPGARSLSLPRPGAFRAEGLEPGLRSVAVRLDGVERSRVGPIALEPGDVLEGLVLEIGPPARAARGVVLDAAREGPLAGARVELFADRTGVPARFSGAADASGRFEIGLPPDAVVFGLVARAGNGRLGLGAASIALDGAGARLDGIVAVLAPGGRLAVEVEEAESGAPLARAAAAAVIPIDPSRATPIDLPAAGPGVFSAVLAPGVYDVVASAAGRERGRARRVAVAAGSLASCRLALARDGEREGRCGAE